MMKSMVIGAKVPAPAPIVEAYGEAVERYTVPVHDDAELLTAKP